MLYIDIPTGEDIAHLGRCRADACVSLYLETTPHTQHIGAARIAFANLIREALGQLDAIGFDPRRAAAIAEQLHALDEDDGFWAHQAHSLCVLATADSLRAYRLANRLTGGVHLSDRFHLKPLLRSMTFPHKAWVLALGENGVRLIRVHADLPAEAVRVPGLPKDAASFAGKSTLNDRTDATRGGGPGGQKMRLRQYVRRIDEVLRPVLRGSGVPLILAAAEPLASLYRAANRYAGLADRGLAVSPGEMTAAELAGAARSVLDEIYRAELAALRALVEQRAGQGRAIHDIAMAARAAVAGAIELLLVDIDHVVPGFVDDATGQVIFVNDDDARAYDVIDDLAVRSLHAGAHIIAVRADDLPGHVPLIAVTRYPA